MELFNALMAGCATAVTPINLLWALLGCALGTAVAKPAISALKSSITATLFPSVLAG